MKTRDGNREKTKKDKSKEVKVALLHWRRGEGGRARAKI
jgi:hypothetical protein